MTSAEPLFHGPTVGVVYLLRAGTFYKIGKSVRPGRRYSRLAIQLPDKPELVHEIETNDPNYLERHWHLRFKEKRANGEWFALSVDEVAEFKKCRVVWLDWRPQALDDELEDDVNEAEEDE